MEIRDNKGDLVRLFQTVLKQNGYSGDFKVDIPTRTINATDNSIYEVLPLAVAQPKTSSDLEVLLKLANQPPFNELYFTARGGGTGTNGQSLTDGVVIDFSRYMTKVIEFNPQKGYITVEPGMILSELNRFLHPHGLFFAPNVSTADRATIGGMIATDAAGKGSLIYGKTADHLLGVRLILANGDVIDTINSDNFLSYKQEFFDQITELLDPVQEEIQRRFPPLKRPLSGYNIKQCYQNGMFDLNRLIAGSEGTLGVVTAAKLNLLPIPKHKTMIVVHYDSFLDALNDARFLIEFNPLAIEAIDEKVQKSAQSLPNWPTFAKWLNSEGKTYISNFVEFVADTKEELEIKIKALQEALDAKNANYVTITDSQKINQLWSIRSLAVGLAAKIPGRRKPVAFVEDAIVPPEHLASLVADLQQELDRQGLNYAMYGHVDVGCIHVRPALDMQQDSDRALIRPITTVLIELLNKYQGILWGEHGKGYRGEFVPEVFGPILYPVLCSIKRIFDPNNRLNPGKLTSPDFSRLIRIEDVTMRGQLDQSIPAIQQDLYNAAMICNGNGACFNQDPANVMCPSYKVTQDRIHSPKGRAMLVKSWLREKAQGDQHKAKVAADNAFEALSGCLGCKGCAGKCPTQVSIPDLRTRFLETYHREYRRRSLRDMALAHVEHILPLAAKFPRLWNFVTSQRWIPKFGISNVPNFSTSISLFRELKRYRVQTYSSVTQIPKFGSNPVVIFADVFSGLLNPQILISSIEILKALNFTPYIIYPRASGKALIVAGLIEQFKKNSQKIAGLLDPLLNAQIPVVGLENTITLMFRDELSKFASPLAGKVLTLAEFLSQHLDKLKPHINSIRGEFRLLPHCTEQALLPKEGQTWQQIFALFDAKLEIKNSGCCGMAGTYGHLEENIENSSKLFHMHWQKEFSSEDTKVLATGYSCRTQSKQMLGITVCHPIEIVANSIKSNVMKNTSYK